MEGLARPRRVLRHAVIDCASLGGPAIAVLPDCILGITPASCASRRWSWVYGSRSSPRSIRRIRPVLNFLFKDDRLDLQA